MLLPITIAANVEMYDACIGWVCASGCGRPCGDSAQCREDGCG
eukprot:gene9576-16718_t